MHITKAVHICKQHDRVLSNCIEHYQKLSGDSMSFARLKYPTTLEQAYSYVTQRKSQIRQVREKAFRYVCPDADFFELNLFVAAQELENGV
jgi:hypothetical protein